MNDKLGSMSIKRLIVRSGKEEIMKKVLIILANYSPNPSSVANCMKPLIEKLSQEHHVDVITDRKRKDVPIFEKRNNVDVYRVDDRRIMNTISVNEMIRTDSSLITRIFLKFFAFISKTAYFFRYTLFSFEKISGGWEIDRVSTKVNDLDKVFDYDVVISASLPYQSHLIAEKLKILKGENIKWIVFQFDPFTYNGEIKANKNKRRKMSIVENRIFDQCDCIILTPELSEFYYKNEFLTPSSKVHSLSFSNLEEAVVLPSSTCANFMIDDKINCLFAGRLYDDIRNPHMLLKLFSSLDSRIQLTLMTNMPSSQIKKYSPKDYQPQVVSFQDRDTALFNILNANILVNIGNTVEFQVPGKLFEYMSTGKPIIHFSKIKNDPALKYLKRYKNVFVVNEWDRNVLNCISDLENFCYNNKNVRLSFSDVNRQLGKFSREMVESKFLGIFNDLLGDS
jgi:glycosyltransferase involved in cell wall biosynthesis